MLYNILIQLLIGTFTILIIVVINVEMFEVYSKRVQCIKNTVDGCFPKLSRSAVTFSSVLWIILSMSLQVWAWAIVLQLTGAVTGLEPSVYFALVCFTTLGFGDIILSKEWRLLSAIIASNGLVMFSWSSAFLFDILQKIRND